jgi:hypothetical protein
MRPAYNRDTEIQVYRGLRNKHEYDTIKRNRTAGGGILNYNATPPGDDVNHLKAVEVFPAYRLKCTKTPKYVEYSKLPTVAGGFARSSGYLVEIIIEKKYAFIDPNTDKDPERGIFFDSSAPIIWGCRHKPEPVEEL